MSDEHYKPKTHILRLNDGKEYRLDEDLARSVQSDLDSNGVTYIDEDRIRNAEVHSFRKIRRAPASLALDAGNVFDAKNNPEWYFWAVWLWVVNVWKREHKRIVYATIIREARNKLETDNPWVVVAFLWDKTNWKRGQIYNKPDSSLKRIDRSRSAEFEPSNTTGRRCGKCMDGWLPGDQGLRLCKCYAHRFHELKTAK